MSTLIRNLTQLTLPEIASVLFFLGKPKAGDPSKYDMRAVPQDVMTEFIRQGIIADPTTDNAQDWYLKGFGIRPSDASLWTAERTHTPAAADYTEAVAVDANLPAFNGVTRRFRGLTDTEPDSPEENDVYVTLAGQWQIYQGYTTLIATAIADLATISGANGTDYRWRGVITDLTDAPGNVANDLYFSIVTNAFFAVSAPGTAATIDPTEVFGSNADDYIGHFNSEADALADADAAYLSYFIDLGTNTLKRVTQENTGYSVEDTTADQLFSNPFLGILSARGEAPSNANAANGAWFITTETAYIGSIWEISNHTPESTTYAWQEVGGTGTLPQLTAMATDMSNLDDDLSNEERLAVQEKLNIPFEYSFEIYILSATNPGTPTYGTDLTYDGHTLTLNNGWTRARPGNNILPIWKSHVAISATGNTISPPQRDDNPPIPIPTAADANDTLIVNATGDYVLQAPANGGTPFKRTHGEEYPTTDLTVGQEHQLNDSTTLLYFTRKVQRTGAILTSFNDFATGQVDFWGGSLYFTTDASEAASFTALNSGDRIILKPTTGDDIILTLTDAPTITTRNGLSVIRVETGDFTVTGTINGNIVDNERYTIYAMHHNEQTRGSEFRYDGNFWERVFVSILVPGNVPDDLIVARMVADGAIGESHLAAQAVRAAAIGAGAVTFEKIANGAVRNQHLATFSIDYLNLRPDAVRLGEGWVRLFNSDNGLQTAGQNNSNAMSSAASYTKLRFVVRAEYDDQFRTSQEVEKEYFQNNGISVFTDSAHCGLQWISNTAFRFRHRVGNIRFYQIWGHP